MLWSWSGVEADGVGGSWRWVEKGKGGCTMTTDCSGCELGRAASFAFWRCEIELRMKLADSRVVHTNFLSNLPAGFALFKQEDDVILSLLGNGFHDDGDRGVRDAVP